MSDGRCRGALLPGQPRDLVSSVNLTGPLLKASSVNLLEASKETPHGVCSLLGLAPCLVHGLQNWKFWECVDVLSQRCICSAKQYLEIQLQMGAIRDTVLHQVCLLLKNDLVDKPPELRVSPWAPGKSDASELLRNFRNFSFLCWQLCITFSHIFKIDMLNQLI